MLLPTFFFIYVCDGLTLAGREVPTKPTLSLPSSAGWEKKYNRRLVGRNKDHLYTSTKLEKWIIYFLFPAIFLLRYKNSFLNFLFVISKWVYSFLFWRTQIALPRDINCAFSEHRPEMLSPDKTFCWTHINVFCQIIFINIFERVPLSQKRLCYIRYHLFVKI